MCLSEHWFTDDGIKLGLKIPGFNLIHEFSRRKQTHGGVAILVSKNMVAEPIEEVVNISQELHFECAAIKLINVSVKLIIVTVYRSCAGGNVDIFLEKLIQTLDLLLKPAHNLNNLLDILGSYYLKPVIYSPTRGRACLDNICIHKGLTEFRSEVIHAGFSDHAAQAITLPVIIDNVVKTKVYSRNLSNRQNLDYFKHLLSSENWEEVFMTEDVDSQLATFLNIISYYFDIAFPLLPKTITSNKKNNSWITPGIKISSLKLKLLHKAQEQGSVHLQRFYNKYKSVYRKVIRLAKKLYNDKKILQAGNKNKCIWEIINEGTKKIQNKKTIGLKIDNKIVTDQTTCANFFNEYFNKITDNIIDKNYTEGAPKNLKFCKDSLFLTPVTEQELFLIIQQLKNSNSHGDDNISSSIIKQCATEIIISLKILINNSFEKGIFPNILKTAKIFPLHKRDDKTNVANYRPISILSVFSKVVEKAFSIRLINFLSEHDSINTNQHGFRKGRSTSSAIAAFLDELLTKIDAGHKCLGLFIDLNKAFDLVNYEILSDKLYALGIRGTPLQWIRSYLSDRKHFVQLGNHRSEKLYSKRGVPQGSVLGPLAYIILVSDMILDGTIMYADDISLVVSAKNENKLAEIAQNKLENLHQYILSNKLSLNSKKTNYMQFNISNRSIDRSYLLKVDSESIKNTDKIKFLGVVFNNNLKWHDHIDDLCKKLATFCYVLKRLRDVVSLEVLKTYYFAHFHSVLSYGVIAWGMSSESRRAFVLQKRAIRNMLNLHSRTSCRPYFQNLNILTLPCIFIFTVLLFAKTNIYSFSTLGENHEYETRNTNSLQVMRHKTAAYENCPSYLSVQLYNKLPKSITDLDTQKFKISVKNLLIKKAYYSVEEYLHNLGPLY